jgi:hypothetical protein
MKISIFAIFTGITVSVLGALVWFLGHSSVGSDSLSHQKDLGQELAVVAKHNPKLARALSTRRAILEYRAKSQISSVIPGRTYSSIETDDIRPLYEKAIQQARIASQQRHSNLQQLQSEMPSNENSLKFSQSSGSFSLLPNVRALPSVDAQSSNGYDVVGKNAGFTFVHLPMGQNPPTNSLPAVVGPTGLGAITGNIKVAVDSANAQSLASDFNMTLIQSFDSIGVSFFQSNRTEPQALLQLQAALQNDPRVAKTTTAVDLEVLNRNLRPN